MAFDAVPEITTAALALLDESVTEVATMVTLPPVGVAAGAVYVVAVPLGVEVGLKAPHAFAGVQLQFTPPGGESFCTVAATLVVPPVKSHAGGIVESAMDMAGGGGGLVTGAGILPPPHPEIAATMLMVRPIARRDQFQFFFVFTAPSDRGKVVPPLRWNQHKRTRPKPDLAQASYVSEELIPTSAE